MRLKERRCIAQFIGFNPSYFCINSMDMKDVKKAINASMGFPIVNGPRKFCRRICLDGGSTDNVPVYPMQHAQSDHYRYSGIDMQFHN